MNKEKKYPCPSCGGLVFDIPPKSFDACPLCEMRDNHLLIKNTEKEEKGDYRGFIISFIVLAVSISLLLHLYFKFDAQLMEIWGSRSVWYLEEYRPLSAKVWRMLYRVTYSWTFVLLPVLWMSSAFLIQSVLQKNKAKIFNKCHTAIIIVLSAIAFLVFVRLLLLPLIQPIS